MASFVAQNQKNIEILLISMQKKAIVMWGYIPTNINDCGKIKNMDLVFETDLENA